jgi:chemotaxis methyl-accepting protein methylase
MLPRFISSPFLRLNESAWRRLPTAIRQTHPLLGYGRFLHAVVQSHSDRRQYHGTFFLRNRPELDLLREIASKCESGSILRIGIVACSNGAEVYSIVWAIRSARPDLNLIVQALDISSDVVEIAREGRYPLETQELIGSAIFERLTDAEKREMFECKNGWMTIKPWLRQGIQWLVADAGDPELVRNLGPLDIVVANKFLCHMPPREAESCLRKVARLVRPGGYLFVSGVDLDVRTQVAVESRWTPVQELIEEIHEGDVSVRRDWPWRYWGLEPFDRTRKDWMIRYASAFRVGREESSAVEEAGMNSERVFSSIA